SSYPASRKASAGASGSASLVSCISSTSGRARSSHHVTFSRRAFSELTFQVAILTSPSYEEPAKSASPSWSLRGKGFSAMCPAFNLRGSLPGSMGREAHPEAKTFWPVDAGDRRDPGCGGRRGGIRDFRDHAAQAPTQDIKATARPVSSRLPAETLGKAWLESAAGNFRHERVVVFSTGFMERAD